MEANLQNLHKEKEMAIEQVNEQINRIIEKRNGINDLRYADLIPILCL